MGWIITPASLWYIFIALHELRGLFGLCFVIASSVVALCSVYITTVSLMRWRKWKRYLRQIAQFIDSSNSDKRLLAELQIDQASAILAEIERDVKKERHRFRHLFKLFGH